MTYWEFAKTLTAEQFVKWFKDTMRYGCRQSQQKTQEDVNRVWRDLCRIQYKDVEGCYRCVADWFNTEIPETKADKPKEKQLDGQMTVEDWLKGE